jgi:hypothetical protein
MSDPCDIVDIAALRTKYKPPRRRDSATKPWLAVWFRCCHTYGRMYRNRSGTMYEGRCPRCGAPVKALIGPNGTSQRIFQAR